MNSDFDLPLCLDFLKEQELVVVTGGVIELSIFKMSKNSNLNTTAKSSFLERVPCTLLYICIQQTLGNTLSFNNELSIACTNSGSALSYQTLCNMFAEAEHKGDRHHHTVCT